MKNIFVVTGSRAEYGLLKNILKGIQLSKKLNLNIVITGSHISKKHGLTYTEIINDGFTDLHIVDMQLVDDSSENITKSMGFGLIGFAKLLNKLSADLLIITGDRYEAFVASSAAMIAKIPIAHIHGGEITEGAIDDSIRHAITKLSHLHFVAIDEYKNRVIQMGENPNNVYCIGGLGAHAITKTSIYSRNELEAALQIKLKKINLLITYHPETLGKTSIENQIHQVLSALEEFTNANLIFTSPNADMGGNYINNAIKNFVSKTSNAYLFSSLGQKKYFSCLAHFDCVIGNSSSGIMEAPSFQVPTVNIGDRQKGRIMAKSIINCECNSKSIKKAIEKSLSDEFKRKLKFVNNPYVQKNTINKLIEIIEEINLKDLLQKKFYDIKIPGK